MVKKLFLMHRLILLCLFFLTQFIITASGQTAMLSDSALVNEVYESTIIKVDSIDESDKMEIELELENYSEIDKLVVNNSKTKAGRDFYDLFMKQWNISGSSFDDYTIIITEKPYRLTITQIEIKVNDQLVYNSTIQPRLSLLESAATQAVSACSEFLTNYELIMQLLENEDQDYSDY